MGARLVRLGVLALAAAGALAAVLWLAQRRLLYFPDREARADAERRARALGLEPWEDGGELLGWHARTPGAGARLVVFHGNAGSALDRGYVAAAFRRALPDVPVEVYLAEYPGYGPRPGAASEPALRAEARRAIAAARRGAPGPVLVLGESLGAAVAAVAAADEPAAVDGLLLVTPLASVPAVARRHYPLVPGFLLRDRWEADRALPRYRGRVAFLLAGADEITFADLGRALHDAYPGPKRLWVEEGAGHNGLGWDPASPRFREMLAFVLGRDR